MLSAKERLAAFQSKTETKEVKKTAPGPRKIGKLNIPGQKAAEPEKPAPKKKVVKKKPKMNGDNSSSSNGEAAKKEPAKPEVVAAKPEVPVADTLKDVDLDLSVELEANINVKPKPSENPEPAPTEKPKEEKPVEKTQEPKKEENPKDETPSAAEQKPAENTQAPKKEEKPKEEKPEEKDSTDGLKQSKPVPAKEENPADDAKVTKKEAADKQQPVVVPELTPTPAKEVEATITVVAGIEPGSGKQQEKQPPASADKPSKPVEPTSLTDVKAETKTVAGITPDAATVKAAAPVEPTALKAVQAQTRTVAGIEPAATAQPQAKAAAGQEIKHVQPSAMPAPEAKTMKVAGIGPEIPKQQPQVHPVAPSSLKKVEAKTTTVAGIAPAGAQPVKQQPQVAAPNPAPTPASKPEPVPAAKPEPPAEPRRRPPQKPLKKKSFEPIPDEFFDNLFYFSGMGTVVGSALSKGVYVPKRSTNTALDVETIEKYEAQKDEEIAQGVRVVKKARNEAVDLAEELRKLQALLSGLPSFSSDPSQSRPAMPRVMPLAPPPQPRRFDAPALDLITKKVEAVAKDIPTAPRVVAPPPPMMPKPAPAPEPIKSAFTPVAQAPPPRAPVEHRVPPISAPGTTSNVGVFKGMTNGPGAKHQSWQDKYAGKSVTDAQAPKPFPSGGEIPSGLKPWELSRLRGLEARGFEFSHDQPESGADYSDDFYHGGSHMDTQPEISDDISSYAPFLVSSKSKKVDRAKMLSHEAVTGDTFVPSFHVLVPPAGPPGQPMQASPSLPYCDL